MLRQRGPGRLLNAPYGFVQCVGRARPQRERLALLRRPLPLLSSVLREGFKFTV